MAHVFTVFVADAVPVLVGHDMAEWNPVGFHQRCSESGGSVDGF